MEAAGEGEAGHDGVEEEVGVADEDAEAHAEDGLAEEDVDESEAAG